MTNIPNLKKQFAFGLVLLFSLGLLSGCLGGGSTTEESVGLVLPEENYKFYVGADWQIQYPFNWAPLNSAEISNKFSENLEAAFISNFKDLFFTPVITVEKVKARTGGVSSIDFAEDILTKNKNSLVEFNLLEKQSVSTLVGSETVITNLARFQGKETLADDKLEYIQIYLVKGETGFIATGAYDPTDNLAEADKILNSLRTFRLK